MYTRGILVCIFLICCIESSATKYKLSITSTSPVALDTPIFFNAEIFPGENKNYSFHWKDNTGFHQKIVTEGPRSNWSIIYPTSRYREKTGKKTVTVKVFNADSFLYFSWLAEESLTYTLNDRITGNLAVAQPNVTDIKAGCISTLNVTNITTTLHDPFGWIKDRTEQVTFYYNINNKDNPNQLVIGPCLSPSVLVNITEPGRYIIEAVVILSLSNQPTTPKPTTTTTTTTPAPKTTTPVPTTTAPKTTARAPTNTKAKTTPPTTASAPRQNTTAKSLANVTLVPTLSEEAIYSPGYQCGGHWLLQNSTNPSWIGAETKYTFTYVSVTAAEPLSTMKIAGDTWLKHGEMLRLHINCTGTAPYNYCFNITHGSFNETDPKICTHQRVYTNVCDFDIVYYLPKNGTYSLVLAMDNDVSSRTERHALHVYNTDKEKQLTYIIVPMTCTVIAIVMIIFGIARYIQNKTRYSIEVADFDFGVSDEQVYKPFLQQLREAITSSCTANFEDQPKRRYIERPQILEDDD